MKKLIALLLCLAMLLGVVACSAGSKKGDADAMKIGDEYGYLKIGRAADITVFNEDIDVKYTMVDGEMVFEA